MSWYKTGTLTLTNGSTAVTGSGTAFIANAAAGEALLAPDGKFYEIAAVVSDVSLTLGSNYLGATASGQAYTILPSQSFVRDLAAQAAALIQTYADIATGAGAGKFSAGTSALPGIAGSADTDTGINLAGSNVLNLVAGGATRVAVTTAGAAVTGTLSTSGNATLGDSTSADSHTVNGIAAISASSASPALKITQAGAGNALTVEDVASDTTPFVIDGSGRAIIGNTVGYASPNYNGAQTNMSLQMQSSIAYDGISLQNYVAGIGAAIVSFAHSRGVTMGVQTVVNNGDMLGTAIFSGSDGTAFIPAAQISASVDGVPGTNDMPGRLVFSTTADGASTPTERMRIDASGRVSIGAGQNTQTRLYISGACPGDGSYAIQVYVYTTIDPASATVSAHGYVTASNVSAGTLPVLGHFTASQGTYTGTVTTQYAFQVQSSMIGATNNYGFFGSLAAGTGRWNFYANGDAANHFTGVTTHGAAFGYGTTSGVGGTVTQATSKSTGVTLNKPTGQITLNAASLAASTTALFTLTNSAIGANDTIICHRKSGGTAGAYQVWVDSVAAGSCVIAVRNTTAGALAEAPLLQYSIIKGAIA